MDGNLAVKYWMSILRNPDQMVVNVIPARSSRSHFHVRLYDSRLYIVYGALTGLLRPEDRSLRLASFYQIHWMANLQSLSHIYGPFVA